jgi:hypothetical protein
MKLSTKVWLSETAQKCINPSGITDSKNAQWLSFRSEDLLSHGYMLIGTATIEVEFLTPAEINNSAGVGLKAQVQEVKARAEKEVMHLQDKINQLLAITNEA